MKLELSEKQVKAIIELASKNPDVEELQEIKALVDGYNENKSNLECFIDKYKYECDKIINRDGENEVDVLICGIDYFAHWTEGIYDVVKLNNFMVNYEMVISAKEWVLDDSMFKEDSYYKELHSKFKDDLSKMGISIYIEDVEEYDVLISYSLPTSKVLDDEYIKEFVRILEDYRNSFSDEMDYIYTSY